MTAQINDTFRYREHEYGVAGISAGELFDPELLDLKPAAMSSACWRGYQAVFGISNARLVLDTLHVNLINPQESDKYEPEVGPVINGIRPVGSRGEHDWFNNHYEGLTYHLEYTGGVLLADGFIDELYVHMGFHPAWKYERVIELIFDAGILKQEFDRSEQMAEIRQYMTNALDEEESARPPTDEEARRFVEGAFDRRYRL